MKNFTKAKKNVHSFRPLLLKNVHLFRTLLLTVVVLVVAFQGVKAMAAADDPDAATVFGSTCATCHGKNGVPTPTGKSLNAPDLTSAAVQGHTDGDLQQIISGGKGNMPPFADSLSEAQIKALVAYVRTLASQHKAGKQGN
ncbi:MAG TPA: cytochrome c [Candidatus Binatia bacterium]|nr:cytochrome c [Candidatus Binatia bacterium]